MEFSINEDINFELSRRVSKMKIDDHGGGSTEGRIETRRRTLFGLKKCKLISDHSLRIFRVVNARMCEVIKASSHSIF